MTSSMSTPWGQRSRALLEGEYRRLAGEKAFCQLLFDDMKRLRFGFSVAAIEACCCIFMRALARIRCGEFSSYIDQRRG
jgi:hypothetical protein